MYNNERIRIYSLIASMLLIGMAFSPVASADIETYATSETILIEGSDEAILYSDITFAKLNINPTYSNIDLKPGDNNEISVTVTNKDNKTITLEPKMVPTAYQQNLIDENWVSITPSSKDLEPEEKVEFTIKVDIPEDADIGDYGASVAFTDDTMPQSYSVYPQYINAMYLYIEVWTPPNIQIQTSYIRDRVESGEEYDYEITLKNIADHDIEIDPEFDDDQWSFSSRYGTSGFAFESDAMEITAPSVVKAGETAVVNVHLEVPEDARGTYYGDIDLNIDDPSIDEWDDEVSLNFDVWTQPVEPYAKKFTTQTNDPITIKLSSSVYNYDKWMRTGSETETEDPSFDLELENGSGNVELKLIRTTYGGTVSLGASSYPPWEIDSAGIYQETLESYVETYETSGAVGEWTLNILPINIEEFDYLITIGDSE